VVKRLQEKGLLALPAGPSVVRFLAPFTAEKEDFDRAAALFAETLEEGAE
jgi:acetylornithine/LysW-gamma-L-lysine aminotransferase